MNVGGVDVHLGVYVREHVLTHILYWRVCTMVRKLRIVLWAKALAPFRRIGFARPTVSSRLKSCARKGPSRLS
jgi:hypothetical protein